MATTVSLIGSTGSIGTQAIEVLRAASDRFRVVAIAANRSVELLAEQAAVLRPDAVAIADESRAGELRASVDPGIEVLAGPDSLGELATRADTVLNAVVGFAGLPVTLAALDAGKRLALANKESLIAAGPVVQRARKTPGAEIVPVDSEHSAIHQCLLAAGADGPAAVHRVVLTASGGPFRGRDRRQLQNVTVAEALAHPTWRMGPKITVDSSTLMNKGLEVIEAIELFGLDVDSVSVVIHPESVVHSMVEFTDGASIAQLSQPDMRLAIGYALAFPARLSQPCGRLDWTSPLALTFEPPDEKTFRCLALAYDASRRGGTAPAWLNAANEVAVAAFLEGRIGWLAIAEVIEAALDTGSFLDPGTVDDVLAADAAARRAAGAAIERMQS